MISDRLLQRLFAPVVTFFLAAAFSTVHAQGLGTITGIVTDPSGGAIASASLKLTDTATAVPREAVSGLQGYFVFKALRPSTYSLSVDAPGFSTSVRREIVLQADGSVTINVTMAVRQSSESVTVDAQPAAVNTTTSAMSEVVEQRRILDLPLNGRNAASLTLLCAGTVLAPPSGDEGNTKTFPAAVTFSANGSRQNQTTYRLDGANNNDIYTNVNQPFPFPDALQEFSVQTSNYSAKYGGNAGPVVNVVTNSGTNELHGRLFEFNRNASINARNFFARSRDQLKRNQFGGTFGGPISIPRLYNGKNKTFFFVGYQGTRVRNDGAIQNAYFPTSANLNGDFSASAPVYDPSTCSTPNKLSTCTPFPGNRIPVDRFDRAAVALTKYLPTAQNAAPVFYGIPGRQNFDEIIARVDHNISTADRLTGRYFFDRFENPAFMDTQNYVRNSPFANVRSQNMMLNETHTFSPSLLNDLHVSVARETSQRGPAAGSINAADLGVQGVYMPPGEKFLQTVQVSGFFTVTQQPPASFARTHYSLSDSIYWIRGAHAISVGGEVNRAWVLVRNQARQGGLWTFTADATGVALASFMLGKTRTFRQGNGEYKDNRVNTFGLHIHDDWRVSRKLTLNLGLRYDPSFPWKETKGRVSVFRPDAYAQGIKSQMYVNAPPGLLFAGDAGVPQYGVFAAMKNVAPRVGFAYDVSGNGKMSIRSGFGVFFDSQQNGVYNNQFVNVSPFSTQISLTNPAGPFANPYLGISNPFPAPYPPPKDIAFPNPNAAVTYDPSNGSVYQTPVIYSWNLSVERRLSADWLLKLAYVGSHSSHLMETLELSPTIYGSGGRRYFNEYSGIASASNDVNSSYNSLQVTLQKRISTGLTVLGNYTWSKSIDTLPFGQSNTTVYLEGLSPIPWYMSGRHQFDRGRSEFDHRQRLVTSFVWDMPKLTRSHAAVRAVAGGWQMSGLLSVQSGGPVTVTAGRDLSGTALGSDRGVLLNNNVYGVGACGNTANCVDYLNPAAFGLPAAGTFGNLGKGALNGPDMITYDGGLFKEIPVLGDRMRLQFRAEYFNLFNRANFFNPGGASSNNQANTAGDAAVISNPGFGSIKAAFDPRIGQLGLKLIF